MKTIVYLIRHSEPMKVENLDYNDSLQLKNEKNILSINGEKRAEILSNYKELKNIDIVISSNYVRAISTAKYIAANNNLKVFVAEQFGERKYGITSWDEKPSNFEQRQIEDENYKIGVGESQKEVRDRMYLALTEVLNKICGKRIAIVSHATALMFLFMKFCRKENNTLYFKDKVLFDNNYKWQAPELFKLTFNDKNELLDIENIRPEELK